MTCISDRYNFYGDIKLKKYSYIMIFICLIACSDNSKKTKSQTKAPSSNSLLLQAYDRCVVIMSKDILKDNPNIKDKVILNSMLSGAKQSCTSAVYKTCDADLKSQSCQLILKQYQ